MKSITEWIESGKSLKEDIDLPIDSSYVAAINRINIDHSDEIIHGVTCISEYKERVPKRLHYALLEWNKLLSAAKEKGLNLKELRTSTLGVISSAWFVLFESYRAWGAEYAAKKGKSFMTELNREIDMLSRAWMNVKAGKPVKP